MKATFRVAQKRQQWRRQRTRQHRRSEGAMKREGNETVHRPMQENKKKVRETNELNNGTKTRRRSRARTNLQWHENKTMQLAEEKKNKRAGIAKEEEESMKRKWRVSELG